MTLLAVIPARGGSKGIPRKNIRTLAGKPLIAWTIEAARQAVGIDRLIVTTEDEEIAEVSRALGADVPFMRPAELARDDTPGVAPILHAIEQLAEHDWILMLQPTSPLRMAADIDGIITFCHLHEGRSAVSVCAAADHPYWTYHLDENARLHGIVEQGSQILRRQDLPEALVLNGALYLVQRDWLLENRQFVTEDTLGYRMPPERSVDIDTALDWKWAELLLGQSNDQ